MCVCCVVLFVIDAALCFLTFMGHFTKNFYDWGSVLPIMLKCVALAVVIAVPVTNKVIGVICLLIAVQRALVVFFPPSIFNYAKSNASKRFVQITWFATLLYHLIVDIHGCNFATYHGNFICRSNFFTTAQNVVLFIDFAGPFIALFLNFIVFHRIVAIKAVHSSLNKSERVLLYQIIPIILFKIIHLLVFMIIYTYWYYQKEKDQLYDYALKIHRYEFIYLSNVIPSSYLLSSEEKIRTTAILLGWRRVRSVRTTAVTY
ncbi:unnamed protein product [Caenorhabditis auriculariae]|uniref:Uncharacterized protein n=1 Tax=Caenorhabditis auriculariae TaxID=2777116 RepID=A0A8S1GWP4_9PELO|nr:unnamed protein product [Caenorhabditis auriculariae]